MSDNWVTQVRYGVIVTLASFILLGPAYRQVLGGTNAFMPKWTMFSGMALNFFELGLKARRDEADQWQAVSLPPLTRPASRTADGPIVPITAARLRTLREVEGTLRKVCAESREDAELEVTLRKADRALGWKKMGDSKQRSCAELLSKNLRHGSDE